MTGHTPARSPHPSLPVLVGVVAVVALALMHRGEIRERAEVGLGRGVPAREAALARGFVLGEEDGIDGETSEDFRRSGLSHLLAVSGENVTLLALLAMPLLGWLGIPLRERLLWLLAAIAVYVPLAGAGASIQRAGVMGAAGVLATLGGRRGSRLFALAAAATVTMAIDPAVGADVGWQLSFAAVIGILLLARPLRRAIAVRVGPGGLRGALADGLAVTIAATVSTAPLIAFHFGTFSTTTLLANVAAMPAVAPAMWLGMSSAAASQVPGLPVEPLNGLAALLLAYIAQVAAWFGEPSWAEVRVHLGFAPMVATYAGLGAVVVACLRLSRRRRLGVRLGIRGVRPALLALPVVLAAWLYLPGGGAAPAERPPELRVDVLDVGQGDAILLEPAHGPAVLVDGGPPGDDLAAKLEGAGVERLGAAVITHDQSDHAGGVEELLGRFPVARLLYGRLRGRALQAAHRAGVATAQIAAGQVLRSGRLRLQVIWPPPELLSEPPADADPNQLALVTVARWGHFAMLLTADAEAEAVPLDPGPIDVLKVAHHGSEDAGLAALLDRTRPRLAVISVGAGNPYGHPTPGTLKTLARDGIRTLRTDLDGDVVVDIRRHSFELER
jgi:competence protein ComEC